MKTKKIVSILAVVTVILFSACKNDEPTVNTDNPNGIPDQTITS